MSAITPQTELRLLKCPLEADNLNQLSFTNATNQYNYFNGLTHLTVDNFTYQRHDGIIRYPAHIDSILQYNYVMYQNEAYSNKWFYAFITKMEYINDGMTAITIKEDVYQTWQFDIIWKSSFIEREHTNDDGYYKNLTDEGFTPQEYVNNLYAGTFFTNSHIVMATTVSPIDGSSSVHGGEYGGVVTGCVYYLFEDYIQLKNSLDLIASEGKSDGVSGVFMAPDWLTGYTTTLSTPTVITPSSSAVTSATSLGVALRPTTIDGYTPKNKKLFNSPYHTIILDNNCGNSVELKKENFYDSGTHSATIKLKGVVTPGCSIKAIPVNYEVDNNTYNISTLETDVENNQYSLSCGKYPIGSFNVDMYTNWLTQNSINILGNSIDPAEQSLGSALIKTATSGVSGGIQGVNEIFDSYKSQYRASLTPNSSRGNANSGDVTFGDGHLGFSIYYKSMKAEQLKQIDDFFSMYGYKTNRVKTPNITGRSNWNYVKTIGANIEGNIPQTSIEELKDMFNRGITIWHTTTYFLDYSKSNNIVS